MKNFLKIFLISALLFQFFSLIQEPEVFLSFLYQDRKYIGFSDEAEDDAKMAVLRFNSALSGYYEGKLSLSIMESLASDEIFDNFRREGIYLAEIGKKQILKPDEVGITDSKMISENHAFVKTEENWIYSTRDLPCDCNETEKKSIKYTVEYDLSRDRDKWKIMAFHIKK